MSTYSDTSVIVSLFVHDELTPRARGFLEESARVLIVSDFAAAEFASALGNKIRDRRLSLEAAKRVIANFDNWRERDTVSETMCTTDVADASSILRRFDLVLRTPDTLHLAMAMRLGAELVTLDNRMAHAARVLGLPVAAI